jgi:hypothetical protein
MSQLYYILDGHRPVAVDLMTWSRWFEKADRKVRKSELEDGRVVSTVFLGVDHAFGDGPPLVFETMVFPVDSDQEICERCATWEQAEAQHEQVLASIAGTAFGSA